MAGELTGKLVLSGKDANGNQREINVDVVDGKLIIALGDNTQSGTTAERDIAYPSPTGGETWDNTSPLVRYRQYYDAASETWERDQQMLNGAASVAEQGIIGGGTNETDETNNYTKIQKDANLSVISKTTAVTIGGGIANDTRLIGLQITAALTGTCVVTGFADSDGTAQSITWPAGSVGFKEYGGARNAAGPLTITCSNASDDNLVFALWRPI